MTIDLQKKFKYIPLLNLVITGIFAFVAYFKFETNRIRFIKVEFKIIMYAVSCCFIIYQEETIRK